MSHLRNLFHKPAGHEHDLQPVPWKAIPDATRADPGNSGASRTFEATATLEPPASETVDLSTVQIAEAEIDPASRIVCQTDPRSPAADRFRFLRMRLKEPWSTGKLKRLLVTSALPHDGKSTVVLNLATALSERGKRSVLVVEADLHHSSLVKALRLNSWTGLSECLVDDSSPLPAIRRIEPLAWYLMPAGEPRKNPTELLQTPAFGHLMQKLSPCFDWILIDSPPVIPLTDSISLQQHADASLLVVRAGQTPRDTVEQTITLLGKKNILGIVFNGAEAPSNMNYKYRAYDGKKHPQEG